MEYCRASSEKKERRRQKRETERQSKRQRDRARDRETERRLRGRQRQRDRETQRDRKTERQSSRLRDRETERRQSHRDRGNAVSCLSFSLSQVLSWWSRRALCELRHNRRLSLLHTVLLLLDPIHSSTRCLTRPRPNKRLCHYRVV